MAPDVDRQAAPDRQADRHLGGGHQRLRKRIALPVFASDAISSTAYATDEILIVLLIQAQIGPEAWELARPPRHRRRHPADDRRPLLPPDDLRLPVRRRVVRRVAGEPRRDPVAGRRGVAADRLHPHRRRVRRRRRAGDPVGVRLRQQLAGADLPRADPRHDAGQPARAEGVRRAVRPADVPLHHHADAPDRRRPVPDLRPARRPDPARPALAGGPGAGDRAPSPCPS